MWFIADRVPEGMCPLTYYTKVSVEAEGDIVIGIPHEVVSAVQENDLLGHFGYQFYQRLALCKNYYPFGEDPPEDYPLLGQDIAISTEIQILEHIVATRPAIRWIANEFALDWRIRQLRKRGFDTDKSHNIHEYLDRLKQSLE